MMPRTLYAKIGGVSTTYRPLKGVPGEWRLYAVER